MDDRLAADVQLEGASGAQPVEARPEPTTRGALLVARAEARLSALEQAIASQAHELPDVALADLRDTLVELRAVTAKLGEDLDVLEVEISSTSAPDDVAWMERRLDRLSTLERAGESVDAAERERLLASLAAHEADAQARDRLESQHTACLAELLEVASIASRVRRELLSEPLPARSAPRLVKRLQAETRAANAARREAARRT